MVNNRKHADVDIENIIQEYKKRLPIFEQLRAEALYVIEGALERTDIKLHSTASRVKKPESFLHKVETKQLDKPFEQIRDIVGLRVICLFLSDITRIAEVIRGSFFVLAEDNKIEGAEVSSFGYMSVHFIVTMKKEYVGPRYDLIANIPLEIQVRTIAMDAWANVSHHLSYKSDLDVPSDLKRDFYALSGLFFVADKHFEMFFRSSNESREKMVEAFSSPDQPLDQEINIDSLSAYLLNKFPDRGHSDSSSISALVSELSRAGIKYISDIDRAVDKASEAFLKQENDRPPFSTKGKGRFNDVGAVRGSLDIVNQEFRKVRGVPEANVKKYQALLKK
jgi:putative GTP pyrophosphokinase